MKVTDKTKEFILGQLKPLDQEATELKARLAELEAERTPLLEALKALELGTKKKPKRNRKPAFPSVTKEDVQPVCLALVKDNPNIERSDLESLAEEKLVKELGFSRNGLKMQIQKCLNSNLFVISKDDRVRALR